MGEVWRARDDRLGRDVALKVVAGAGDTRRLVEEARAAAGMSHPSILTVHEVGSHEGAPYLVTELLEGRTLREQLDGGPVPLRRVLEWGAQIAAGLAAAHARGIVHRDLKPENLFVTADGRAKILDFGVAKRTAAPAGPQGATLPAATEPGTVLGSVGYMAPEQVRGEAVDGRADLFALGAVLHEMLSGRRTFGGESRVEVGYATLTGDPPPLPATTPAPLARLVRRCLEKDPADRFGSARDLGFALEALLGDGAAVELAGAPAASRSRWLPVAAAGLVLAAAGLVVGRATAPGPAVAPAPPPAVPAPAPAAAPRFTRVTYRTGALGPARFVPGGREVVYAASFEGEPTQIFLGTPGWSGARPVTGPLTTLLSISRQGDLALLRREADGSLVLAQAPLAGGAPRPMMQDVAAADHRGDGSLAVVRAHEGRQRLEYPVGTVLFEADGVLSCPRFSPSGDSIAFVHWPIPRDDRGTVELVTLDGAHRTLAGPYYTVDGLAWRSDSELWFTAGPGAGGRALRAVTLDGKDRVVFEAPIRLHLRDLAADGRALIERVDTRGRLVGLVPGRTREVSLTWFDITLPIDLSPDGRTLLFVEGNTETQSWLRPTDGSPALLLGAGFARALSPDGRWALISPREPYTGLALVPTGPGEIRPLPEGPFSVLYSGRFFADGERILLLARAAEGGTRLWIQDVASGSPRPVGEGGLAGATPPSPDGRLAAAVHEDGRRLLVSLETGAARPLALGPTELPLGWLGDRLLLVRQAAPTWPVEFFSFDVESGKRAPWRSIEPEDKAGVRPGSVDPVLWTPDGRYHVYSYTRTTADLFVAEGLR